MKMKVGMFWVLAAALVSFFILQVPAAKADTITYQVTGTGPDLGTNFTFVSANGFLTTSDFPIVPTTATDLFVGGIDEGVMSSIIITGGGTELEIVAANASFVNQNFVGNTVVKLVEDPGDGRARFGFPSARSGTSGQFSPGRPRHRRPRAAWLWCGSRLV